jgi:triosephosphate isomerase
MSHLIIANHKMNFSLEETLRYCSDISKSSYKNELIIASPAPYIGYLAHNFKSLTFCAQNISTQKEFGAYTGEYSSAMVKSCGVNYSLVGHSERRNLFGETDEIILQKIENCLKSGVNPIVCIGESQKARQNGNYKEFIVNQLKLILHQISLIATANKTKNLWQVIFAYEPIWSIGTGIIPTDDELIEVIGFISSMIKQSLVAKNMKLVYGGSINLDNIEHILSLQNIDGVLIGKASLNSATVLQMLDL